MHELSSLQKQPLLRIEWGEWLDIIVSVIISFFENFDSSVFAEMVESQMPTKGFIKEVNVNKLITRLHKAILRLSEASEQRIGEGLHQILVFGSG